MPLFITCHYKKYTIRDPSSNFTQFNCLQNVILFSHIKLITVNQEKICNLVLSIWKTKIQRKSLFLNQILSNLSLSFSLKWANSLNSIQLFCIERMLINKLFTFLYMSKDINLQHVSA